MSAVFICTLLLGGTGCAGSEMGAAEKPDLNNHSQMDGSTSAPEKDDAGDTEDSNDISAVPGEGSRLAGSLDEYIDSLIADTEWTTDYEREILERAKANGGVSVTDYEHTWSRYKQCMLDKGYKEIILIKYPNGLYHEAPYQEGTARQMAKHDKDMQTCMADVGAVAQVYQMQIGNPTLFSDKNEATIPRSSTRRNGLKASIRSIGRIWRSAAARWPTACSPVTPTILWNNCGRRDSIPARGYDTGTARLR